MIKSDKWIATQSTPPSHALHTVHGRDTTLAWEGITHTKEQLRTMQERYMATRISPEDLTITLGLDGATGELYYMASNNPAGQTFTATFYDAQDQVLSTQTTNLTTYSSVTIPVGATKVELYDTHPTSTYRRISSTEVVSVLKWANREPTLNCHQLYSCINLLTVPNEAPVTTDMGYMFNGCSTFNQDISGWDVSNVTNMDGMFGGCSAFNSDLSGWNVSNVTSMDGMFYDCSLFNQDISGWNVSKVTNMDGMFGGCSAFNSDLSGWNVSNVTSMDGMFYDCSLFNQDISGWNVSKVTNMSYMFYGCSVFNSDLSGWNVSNVTNMSYTFYDCRAFNKDISGWDVSKITKLPSNFVTNAPLMTSEKLPVWGTCPVR